MPKKKKPAKKPSVSTSTLTIKLPKPIPTPTKPPATCEPCVDRHGWFFFDQKPITNLMLPECLFIIIFQGCSAKILKAAVDQLKKTNRLNECLYTTWTIINRFPRSLLGTEGFYRKIDQPIAISDNLNGEERKQAKQLIQQIEQAGFDFHELIKSSGSNILDFAWSLQLNDIIEYLRNELNFDKQKTNILTEYNLKTLIKIPFHPTSDGNITCIQKIARTTQSLSMFDVHLTTSPPQCVKISDLNLTLKNGSHCNESPIISYWLDIINKQYIITFLDGRHTYLSIEQILDQQHNYEIMHNNQSVASGLILGAFLTYGISCNNTFWKKSILESTIDDTTDYTVMRDNCVKLITQFGYSLQILVPYNSFTLLIEILTTRIDIPASYLADMIIAESIQHPIETPIDHDRPSTLATLIEFNRFDVIHHILVKTKSSDLVSAILEQSPQYSSAILFPDESSVAANISEKNNITTAELPLPSQTGDIDDSFIIKSISNKELLAMSKCFDKLFKTALLTRHDPKTNTNLLTNQTKIIAAYIKQHQSGSIDKVIVAKAKDILSLYHTLECVSPELVSALYDLNRTVLSHSTLTDIKQLAIHQHESLSNSYKKLATIIQEKLKVKLLKSNQSKQLLETKRIQKQKKESQLQIHMTQHLLKESYNGFLSAIKKQLVDLGKNHPSALQNEISNPSLVPKEKQSIVKKLWQKLLQTQEIQKNASHFSLDEKKEMLKAHRLYQEKLFELYKHTISQTHLSQDKIHLIQETIIPLLDLNEPVVTKYAIYQLLTCISEEKPEIRKILDQYTSHYLWIAPRWLSQTVAHTTLEHNDPFFKQLLQHLQASVLLIQPNPDTIMQLLKEELNWLIGYISFLNEHDLEAHLYQLKQLMSTEYVTQSFDQSHPIYQLMETLDFDNTRQTHLTLISAQQKHLPILLNCADTLTQTKSCPHP